MLITRCGEFSFICKLINWTRVREHGEHNKKFVMIRCVYEQRAKSDLQHRRLEYN